MIWLLVLILFGYFLETRLGHRRWKSQVAQSEAILMAHALLDQELRKLIEFTKDDSLKIEERQVEAKQQIQELSDRVLSADDYTQAILKQDRSFSSAYVDLLSKIADHQAMCAQEFQKLTEKQESALSQHEQMASLGEIEKIESGQAYSALKEELDQLKKKQEDMMMAMYQWPTDRTVTDLLEGPKEVSAALIELKNRKVHIRL